MAHGFTSVAQGPAATARGVQLDSGDHNGALWPQAYCAVLQLEEDQGAFRDFVFTCQIVVADVLHARCTAGPVIAVLHMAIRFGTLDVHRHSSRAGVCVGG